MNQDILDIARLATRAVMAVPLNERGNTVAIGADGSNTSYIDKVAEDEIIEYMDLNDVQANLLSEEAGFIDRGFEEVLVIDPVDGTYNASYGIPFFSISIARGKKTLADITEGIVMNMVTGDFFHAEKGKGAYLCAKEGNTSFLSNQPIHVREPEKDMALTAYMGSSASPRTYEIAKKFRRVRALGAASLDLCAVASGAADAYYMEHMNQEQGLRIMDIAAGVLILREAGGEAYTPKGEILDMPLSLELRKNIMAVGSKKVLEVIQ